MPRRTFLVGLAVLLWLSVVPALAGVPATESTSAIGTVGGVLLSTESEAPGFVGIQDEMEVLDIEIAWGVPGSPENRSMVEEFGLNEDQAEQILVAMDRAQSAYQTAYFDNPNYLAGARFVYTGVEESSDESMEPGLVRFELGIVPDVALNAQDSFFAELEKIDNLELRVLPAVMSEAEADALEEAMFSEGHRLVKVDPMTGDVAPDDNRTLEDKPLACTTWVEVYNKPANGGRHLRGYNDNCTAFFPCTTGHSAVWKIGSVEHEGIVTAAHCWNGSSTKKTRTNSMYANGVDFYWEGYTYFADYLNDDDAGFLREKWESNDPTYQVYLGGSTFRSINGIAGTYAPLNTTMCGKGTGAADIGSPPVSQAAHWNGVKCGTVINQDTTWGSGLVSKWTQIDYTGSGDSSIHHDGSSGGPWYTGNTLYGVLTGTSSGWTGKYYQIHELENALEGGSRGGDVEFHCGNPIKTCEPGQNQDTATTGVG